jgi:hypothetical protein
VEIITNNTGWCINSSSESLQDFLDNIGFNDILEAKKKVSFANEIYNWDKEASILLKF